MTDSDPAFAAAKDSGDHTDAVLAMSLRAVREEVRRLSARSDEAARFESEVRVYMAETRALAQHRAEIEVRFRSEDWPEMKKRVGKLEDRVNLLEGFRWKLIGAVAAAGALGGGAGGLIQLLSGG